MVYYASDVAKEMNMEFKDEREYGEAVKNAMDNKLSDKAKLAIDYDKMKFEQIYNEEMKKLDEK